MDRQHTPTTTRQRLTAQYVVANFNAQFPFSADMLFQRNNKAVRQRYLPQRRAVGLGLHFRRVNATVKIPQFLFSESGK
ncbi:hypothetical protein ACUY4R_001887 [Kosakonia sp. BK9b]